MVWPTDTGIGNLWKSLKWSINCCWQFSSGHSSFHRTTSHLRHSPTTATLHKQALKGTSIAQRNITPISSWSYCSSPIRIPPVISKELPVFAFCAHTSLRRQSITPDLQFLWEDGRAAFLVGKAICSLMCIYFTISEMFSGQCCSVSVHLSACSLLIKKNGRPAYVFVMKEASFIWEMKMNKFTSAVVLYLTVVGKSPTFLSFTLNHLHYSQHNALRECGSATPRIKGSS